MMPTPMELLCQLANLSATDSPATFALEHPVLFSVQVQAALAETLQTLPEAERDRLKAPLLVLQRVTAALESSPYPIGSGPIEALWRRQKLGEIRADEAERLAGQAEMASLLSPLYVSRLFTYCFQAAQSRQWKEGIGIGRLLLLAAEALPEGPDSESIRQEAVSEWLQVTQLTLTYLADGRLLRNADEAGRRLVERARDRKEPALEGEMLHRLGTLYLDPYTAGRSSINYEVQIEQWFQTLPEALGEDIALLSEETWRMPQPIDALTQAETYLREASPLRSGRERGLTLRALAQTLDWQELLTGTSQNAEVVALCRQALSLFGPDESTENLFSLWETLGRRGAEVDRAAVRKALQISLDACLAKRGPRQTIDFVQQATSILRQFDPRSALDLARQARPVFQRFGSEDQRYAGHLFEANRIGETFAPDIVAGLPDSKPAEGMHALVASLRERAEREKWDHRILSAAWIGLAVHAPSWDEEELGLKLLEESVRNSPLFLEDYREPLDCLRASLWRGQGINLENREDWVSATRAYTRAISLYLERVLPEHALFVIENLLELTMRPDPTILPPLLAGLMPNVLKLDAQAGDVAGRALRKLCKRAVAMVRALELPPDYALLCWQIDKGLHFGMGLAAGVRYHPDSDSMGTNLLEQIRQSEAALSPGNPALAVLGRGVLLDEELLLTAYTRPEDLQAGKTPEERLTNLQHAYDYHIEAQLLGKIEGAQPTYLLSPILQAALDDRTVLLQFHLGVTAEGNLALYQMLLTREEMLFGASVDALPDSLVVVDGLLANPFAMIVQELRSHIQRDPGFLQVESDAREHLAGHLSTFLGNLQEPLERLRAAGKDHLCIVPHGPLHYYPFHLLGEMGHPLAERWIVTYLPDVHLLLPRQGPPAPRRYRPRPLSALGLGFETVNPLGLPPLPQSLPEAREVAAVFETPPIEEEAATRSALLSALLESRYVHLSTHGKHNVNAPAFQCLFLAPEEGGDARFYAHELLSLDLRGVELLTLSACETALGRFDIGDNLRGLPAAFLMAGVSTLVGTLWEVAPNASRLFFVTLYQSLKQGASRRDAFAEAQRTTRRLFPQYRDWGPFYLIGDWS